MTQGPQAGAETARQHFVWDAWNRTVKVEATGNNDPYTVAELAYDGLGRRIRKAVSHSGAWGLYAITSVTTSREVVQGNWVRSL